MNQINQEYIDNILDNASTEEYLFHGGKSMIVSYLLPSGFTIDGRAALVDISKFNILIGRELCRKDASKQLWLLEAYLLQNKLNNK